MYFKIKRAYKDSAICLITGCAQLDMQMTKEKALNEMAVSSGFSESYIDKITLTDELDSEELLSECGFIP